MLGVTALRVAVFGQGLIEVCMAKCKTQSNLGSRAREHINEH
jgi:hypothetical protein